MIVPTAPVPVGGGLFFIPVEMVQPTDVSVEGLMSIYVSMGVSARHSSSPGAGVVSKKQPEPSAKSLSENP